MKSCLRIVLLILLIAIALLVPFVPAIAADVEPDGVGFFGGLAYWLQLLNAWGVLAVVTLALVVTLILWRTNKGSTAYRLGDAMIDPMTGKASILRTGHFVCLIAAWSLVYFYAVQGEEIPASIQTMVLGLLGIFVTPLMVHRVAENFDPRVKAEAANTALAAATEAAKAAQPVVPAPGTTTTTAAVSTTTTERNDP